MRKRSYLGPPLHERLPPEIIFLIFRLFGPTEDGRPTHSTLACVCSQWANLIRHTPELFTRYQLTFWHTRSPEWLVHKARSWFARAGSLPLDLSICYGLWQDFGTVAADHVGALIDAVAPRLRVFRLRIRRHRLEEFTKMLPSFPILEYLDFFCEQTDEDRRLLAGAPSISPPSFVASSKTLKKAVLRGTLDQGFTQNIDSFIPWRALNHLEISDLGISPYAIRQILHLCTNVREVCLKLPGYGGEYHHRHLGTIRPTRLAHLTKLAVGMGIVRSGPVNITPFFSSLSLPALKELSLENESEGNHILSISPALLNLHAQDPFPLQSLVIKLFLVNIDEICRLLSILPTLTSLELFGLDYFTDNFFQFLGATRGNDLQVLPNLESLKLRHFGASMKATVSDRSITQCVQARWWPPSENGIRGVPHLKYVSLVARRKFTVSGELRRMLWKSKELDIEVDLT